MQTFKNTVTLRGFVARNVEMIVDRVGADSYVVLLLGTVSGTWNIAANAWTPRTDWHRIVCPGPYFCGFTRGMKRGEYLEIEGELRDLYQKRGLIIAGERFPISRSVYAVHAIHIRRLERPPVAVDTGEDD